MTLLTLALITPALAEDTKEAPAASLDEKVTAAIIETIEMTSAGDLDGWIGKYCDPSRCSEARGREEFKAYQLKQATLKAKNCMSEDKKIKVTQRQGDVETGNEVRWYLRCEGKQMPTAVRFRYDKENDKVWFSHLGF